MIKNTKIQKSKYIFKYLSFYIKYSYFFIDKNNIICFVLALVAYLKAYHCYMLFWRGGELMKKLKSFALKYGNTLSALALFIGAASVNQACLIFYHQPKVPVAMERFKR